MVGTGKIIKAGSRQSRHVEDIDIFNMKPTDNVESLNMQVVAEAARHIQDLFVEDTTGEHRRFDQTSEELQEEKDEMEVSSNEAEIEYAEEKEEEKESVTLYLEEVEKMKVEIGDLNNKVKEYEKKISEMKANFRKEGYERGYQEGYSKGLVKGEDELKEAADEMKVSFEREIDKLKEKSSDMWESVIETVRFSVKKIVGDSFNEESANAIIEKMRKAFPDEASLRLKVSHDMFVPFNSLQLPGVHVTKDSSMKSGGVAVEMGEGVADFSIDIQIEKIMKWLSGEEDA